MYSLPASTSSWPLHTHCTSQGCTPSLAATQMAPTAATTAAAAGNGALSWTADQPASHSGSQPFLPCDNRDSAAAALGGRLQPVGNDTAARIVYSRLQSMHAQIVVVPSLCYTSTLFNLHLSFNPALSSGAQRPPAFQFPCASVCLRIDVITATTCKEQERKQSEWQQQGMAAGLWKTAPNLPLHCMPAMLVERRNTQLPTQHSSPTALPRPASLPVCSRPQLAGVYTRLQPCTQPGCRAGAGRTAAAPRLSPAAPPRAPAAAARRPGSLLLSRSSAQAGPPPPPLLPPVWPRAASG